MIRIWREKITSSDEIVCSVTPESQDQKKIKDERKIIEVVHRPGI